LVLHVCTLYDVVRGIPNFSVLNFYTYDSKLIANCVPDAKQE